MTMRCNDYDRSADARRPDTVPDLRPRSVGRGRAICALAATAVGLAVPALLATWPGTAGASSATTRAATRAETATVVPAPIGYEIATEAGATHGPVPAAEFDQWVGSGAAASFGYTGGYDVTYNSTATNESLEVSLFRFHSPAGAAAYAVAAMTEGNASSLAPVKKAIRSIPGSTVEIGTEAGSDGFYVVDAFARKGATMMVIEYANTVKPHGVPQSLASTAEAQYGRL